jgi:glycosyltransferase involved in cell wall biosynthesis
VRILYHHRTQAEDGQAVHIRALQRAFAAEGHDVREVGLVRSAGGARRGSSPWALVARAPRFVRELAEYAYTPLAWPGLVRAGREHRADCLYERYAFGNGAGAIAAQRLSIPLVLEVNSPMVSELARTRGLVFERLARKVEAGVFRRADLVCVVSEVLRDELARAGIARERMLVTPNGVDLDSYPARDAAARAAARAALGLARLPADAIVLGFVGFYRDWHRLDLALEALRSPVLARAHLVLVGAGPAHDDLVRRASLGGVEARVHFAGPRAHDAIPKLLAAFDVALVPAINPYASPLKLFEYMAAGLPVVAPDQPNLREVVADGRDALLVEPESSAALSSALARLASDAALRARLGAAARRTVVERDLTWRGNARRVAAAVERLPRARA